jgi:ribosomal-protein-alanine N-acetyltransferase
MKEFRVRAGLARDLADIIALERAAAEAPHWTEADYTAIVGTDNAGYVQRCLFVAEVAESALIGFAVGKVAGGIAELESIAVDSGARRSGIGRTLCSAVIDWCRGQGAAAIELEVRSLSGGAISLYQGLGFVVVGRRPGYYSGPQDDAVLMRLDLPDRV